MQHLDVVAAQQRLQREQVLLEVVDEQALDACVTHVSSSTSSVSQQASAICASVSTKSAARAAQGRLDGIDRHLRVVGLLHHA